MTNKIFRKMGGLLLTLASASVLAAPVVVDPWHTAGNGNATWPFGNFAVSGLELTAHTRTDWGSAGSFNGQAVIWATNFSDLHGVTYTSQPVGDIGLMPVFGNDDGVTLYDFDLGVWGGTSSNVAVRIYNGDYSQILSQGTVAVGAQHGSYFANVFSLNGIHVQFASGDVQHAIDNIRIEGGNPLNIAPIPEPETYAMLLARLGLLGAFARRRKLAT